MDLLDLRYFTEVIVQQNVTKAASRLGIAQPALTRRIHVLEEELATPLLMRHRRGVWPTEAGLLVFERAQHLLRLVNEMRDEVLLRSTEPAGQLRFAYPPSLSNLFLSHLVAQYLHRFPQVSLRLDEHFSPIVRTELLGGQIDLGIMTVEAAHPDLHAIPLFAECLWLVGRTKDWPFGAAKTLSPSRILDQPILIASFLHSVLKRRPEFHAMPLRVRVEADGLVTLRAAIRRGTGLLLGPPSSVTQELDSGEFVGAPVKGLHVTRALFRRRDRPMTRALQELESMIAADAERLLKLRPSMFRPIDSGRRSRSRKSSGS